MADALDARLRLLIASNRMLTAVHLTATFKVPEEKITHHAEWFMH